MYVTRYSKDLKSVWNDFIGEAKNATFLFDRNYMDYHSDRFEDFSLLIYNNKDQLIAALPANTSQEEVFSHQGLSYGGFILKKELTFTKFVAVVQATLVFLEEQRKTILHLKLTPHFYSPIPSEEINYLLFILKASLTRRDLTLAINQREPLRFKQGKKSKINKAKRAELTIKETNDLELFWNNLLTPNLLQQHNTKPVHSLTEITPTSTSFP